MKQLKITKQITNRDSSSLDRYLLEINKIKLISIEEEIDLAKRIKLGDTVALEKLINANLRFVVSVAKQYKTQWVFLGDLINEWNIGLIKAAQRFDETKGFKFISYAVWRIRQYILVAINKQTRIVQLPNNKILETQTIKNTINKLEQNFQRTVTQEEVIETLDMDKNKILNWYINKQKEIFLDDFLLWDDYQWPMIDTIEWTLSMPDENLRIEWLKKEIERQLNTLKNKEKEAIILLFWLNGNYEHSFDETAHILWLKSAGAASTLKQRVCKKLKESKNIEQLKWYL